MALAARLASSRGLKEGIGRERRTTEGCGLSGGGKGWGLGPQLSLLWLLALLLLGLPLGTWLVMPADLVDCIGSELGVFQLLAGVIGWLWALCAAELELLQDCVELKFGWELLLGLAKLDFRRELSAVLDGINCPGCLPGLKVFVAAGAAVVFLWRCLCCRRKHTEEVQGSDILHGPHDIKLEVVSGQHAHKKAQGSFSGEPVSIGRLPHNSLVLADPIVSGEHASVSWSSQQKRWVVVDSGSTNGTKLNSELISVPDRHCGPEYALSDGDVILIAEEIQIAVTLVPPGPSPMGTTQDTAYPVNIAKQAGPKSGTVVAQVSQATSRQLPAGFDPRQPLLGNIIPPPKPTAIEHHFPGLNADLAIATQVGMQHWHSEQGSEDVGYWETPYRGFEKVGLFGVCDGHFGPAASNQFPQLFPGFLSAELDSTSESLLGATGCGDALTRAFEEVDAKLKMEDGTTASVVLAERREDGVLAVQAANVGDSTALVIDLDRRGFQAMTANHRVSTPSETKRLQAKGTPLSHNNTRMYMLNLARAMGDYTFKTMDVGLIAEPHVSPLFCFAPSQQAVVVIASDGLWDTVPQSEVVSVITQATTKPKVRLRDVAISLLKTSIDRGSTDDITVSVIRFWPNSSM